ncbi:MAG: peptide-methionine (S)-S-oxide reductase MsrA [Alphaproteobacteria bacterium]
MAKAYVAGGCFWGIEDAFRKLPGVSDAISGYANGKVPNPTYEQVCTGSTDHAETVEITYDPKVVNYADIIQVFWKLHDPTQWNRQGPDFGTQYRSAIFYITAEEAEIAALSKTALDESAVLAKPAVTLIEPLDRFYPAEDYHQRYFEKRGIKH